MQILRGIVAWWRFAAAAIVLLAGYAVSHYATAATTVALPTPMATAVIEGTPLVIVVTATPSPVPDANPVVLPAPAEDAPTAVRRPPATKTVSPSPPSPTATPAPLAAAHLAVLARVPLRAPADGSNPDGRLAWLADAATLLTADGDGLYRRPAPDFRPTPLALDPMPGNAQNLRLAAHGERLAFTADDQVWAADMGGEGLEAGTGKIVSLPVDDFHGPLRLLRWLPDGGLAATVACGSGCEEMLVLDADGARPLLDFGERISPTLPPGADFLFSPSARLLAFQMSGEPHTIVADPAGDWWFLGAWREPERLRAFDQAVAWLDETVLLSYRRSPSGPSVNGHGLDLWRWDVLANTGRFLVADVATAVPSPDGQRLALVLLGGPAVDEAGHLVGGRWRPDEPIPAVLAVIHIARGTLLQHAVLAEHPGASNPAALDGWAALRSPLWSPDGRVLLAFDGEGRPLLFDTASPDTPPLLLLEQGQPQELAWAHDGSYLALRIGNEVWIVALTHPS